MRRLGLLYLVAGPLHSCAATPEPAGVPPGFVLHYRQDFERKTDRNDFVFSDDAPWVWNREGTLDLVGPSRYAPPHRSPLSIALLRHLRFDDFVLEADVMQTGREYGHRDLCLFFGFVDGANYYYAHLATAPDRNAHNVFLVNEADRRPLTPAPARGVDWGEAEWHHVRLERWQGRIRVFLDDLTTPVLEAYDLTHGLGAVGFGSFDDVGRIDNVRIWAATSTASSSDPFRTVPESKTPGAAEGT